MQVTGEVVRPENRVQAKRRKVVKCSALSVVVSGDGRASSPSVGSTPITTHYAPRRRHCSESKRRYPAEILLCVVFGGHAELLPLGEEDNVHRLAALFSHIWWRTVPGSPYPFTQYKAPARCAT